MDNHQFCPSTKKDHCLTCGKSRSNIVHLPPLPEEPDIYVLMELRSITEWRDESVFKTKSEGLHWMPVTTRPGTVGGDPELIACPVGDEMLQSLLAQGFGTIQRVR